MVYEDIGLFLGQWLGAELKTIHGYNTIDAVVPVPLHKSKFRKRGYNQVTKFGVAIAEALDAEFNSSTLIKTVATRTQVFKSRLKRSSDNDAIFAINEQQNLKGKHILLVDDIITTGATIEHCVNALLVFEGVKISVATMAITD